MVIDSLVFPPTLECLKYVIEIPRVLYGYLNLFKAAFLGGDFELPKNIDDYGKLKPPFKVEDLVMSMDKFVEMLDNIGINHCVLFAMDEETNTGKPVLNDHIAELVRDYPDKFKGFGGADPHKGRRAVEQVQKAFDDGLIGIALRPVIHNLYSHSKEYYPIYSKCQELDMIVWLHTSMNWSHIRTMDTGHPLYLDRVCLDFPELTFIAGHGGWPWVTELMGVVWRRPNVYVDITTVRPKYIGMPGSGWEPLITYGNSLFQDRILFGTSWPILPFEPCIEEVKALPLKNSVKEKWLHKNSERLFKF